MGNEFVEQLPDAPALHDDLLRSDMLEDVLVTPLPSPKLLAMQNEKASSAMHANHR